MGAGGKIWGAVKEVGKWVIQNPNAVLKVADQVKSRVAAAKEEKEAPGAVAERKIGQLGEAVVELDQKLLLEKQQLQAELEALREQLKETQAAQEKLESKMLAYQKKITAVAVILGDRKSVV